MFPAPAPLPQRSEARRALRLRGYDGNAAAELLLSGVDGMVTGGDEGDASSGGDEDEEEMAEEGGAAADAGGAAAGGDGAAAATMAAAEEEAGGPLDAEMARLAPRPTPPRLPFVPLTHPPTYPSIHLPTSHPSTYPPHPQESELAEGVSSDLLAQYDVSVEAEGAPPNLTRHRLPSSLHLQALGGSVVLVCLSDWASEHCCCC